ncbi:MAG: maltose alpha-D-glucosyltransferase, partial [Planctomycetaceae bacterium]|nr:maltose alpha-D-glucosyltransferase [Planctomycetaceae bacterium]
CLMVVMTLIPIRYVRLPISTIFYEDNRVVDPEKLIMDTIPKVAGREDATRWYKDAVIYQTHIRAFADSNNDGIGDFRGLTSRLDYIQDLGVTTVWVLPFYPSPLKDDGYDIADYSEVNPIYGDLSDFKDFLREAHERGLKVVTELVLNHTSDQHAWFQRARRAPKGSKYRDFYVWSDTTDKYKETRIIFKDFEPSNWTWDEVAGQFYWHRFYSHQPDLNFDNPEVHRATLQILDFWLKMGVDGLRLDAVPYLYEREGTSCENLKETHDYLKKLRAHVDAKFTDRMLLAEANQWPEDAVAYFGEGNECHMAFHFPLMPRLYMACQQEDRYPIIDILQQTPAIPDSCQWTIFLRNHDELTLEMVTDEERDYMYRVFANDPQARINLGIRRRLAPLLGNNRRKIELMNGLLLSLPGTPVIYYGDEIGMGDNIYLGDRDSVRTPMQWSADRNAGFSHANPQKLYLPVVTDPDFHFTSINVENEQNSPHSLLWWMKRVIALRKKHKAFSRGTLEFLMPENSKVLAFIRRFEGEVILVVANLSRFVQCAELDLSAFKGVTPIELFGQTRFPAIGELPYFLTLGPSTFYWFALECTVPRVTHVDQPSCQVTHAWTDAFAGRTRHTVEAALPTFLVKHRWFGGKARAIQTTEIKDTIDLRVNADDAPIRLVLIQVTYRENEPETYLLPVAFASGPQAEQVHVEAKDSVLIYVTSKSNAVNGVIYDASHQPECWSLFEDVISRRRRIKGHHGELVGWHNREFRRIRGDSKTDLVPNVLRAEQSNSAAVFADQFVLKLFRKTDAGVNPDLELSRYLTEQAKFPHSPDLTGAIEYHTPHAEPMTLAIMHEYLSNSQQAWEFTLNEFGRYFERVGTGFPTVNLETELKPETRWIDLIDQEPTPLAHEAISPYLQSAALLGQRTAELHLALASATNTLSLAPEPFTPFYQRGLYQSMRNEGRRVLQMLKKQLPKLPEAAQADARTVIGMEADILRRFREITERKITALRIRCHGDYHLGQILYTGKDFQIIDFEGEPMRTINVRRIKRSPLRDVAGMLRSFHYASHAGLLADVPGIVVRSEDSAALAPWARFLYCWTSAVFVKSYITHAGQAAFLPQSRDELRCLLDLYLLEKSLYELDYEMNNRPSWISIPLRGVLDLMNVSADKPTPAGTVSPASSKPGS